MGRRGGALLLALLAFAAFAFAAAEEVVEVPASEADPTALTQPASEADPTAAPAQHAQSQKQDLLIELPSSSSLAAAAGPYEEGLDDVPLDVRCASWRVAAEANNLAPWRAVPAACAAHVRAYVAGAGYRSDLDIVARESALYARAAAGLQGGDGRDAWVFDIDETLLCNEPYYAADLSRLQIFNESSFDEWVDEAKAPALSSSLKLYNELLELGFHIILLTGRSEFQRNATEANLKFAGYHSWEKLILRQPSDIGKPAVQYKSERRAVMEAEGFKILGNSGDQWSDLLGSPMAARSFKLPNPMYFIS